jgi:predicted AlkP superfamily phosphohydrolase/phosphomutase
MLFEVVFFDCCDDEFVVSEKFNTFEEAESWADGCEYDYYDYVWVGDDEVYMQMFRYYNPEDPHMTYTSFTVREVK